MTASNGADQTLKDLFPHWDNAFGRTAHVLKRSRLPEAPYRICGEIFMEIADVQPSVVVDVPALRLQHRHLPRPGYYKDFYNA
jgi:hypothetical protein